jgi:hypothetical protein
VTEVDTHGVAVVKEAVNADRAVCHAAQELGMPLRQFRKLIRALEDRPAFCVIECFTSPGLPTADERGFTQENYVVCAGHDCRYSKGNERVLKLIKRDWLLMQERHDVSSSSAPAQLQTRATERADALRAREAEFTNLHPDRFCLDAGESTLIVRFCEFKDGIFQTNPRTTTFKWPQADAF